MPSPKTQTISAAVERVLRDAEVHENTLAIHDALDRVLYLEVNKVLEALGGKWSRTVRAHVFPRPVADILAVALDSGEALDVKKTYDVYETPDAIIARMLQAAHSDVRRVRRALEPSAGSGRLVRAIRSKWPFAYITAVEIRECTIDGEPERTIRADFLDVDPRVWGPFDIILANPPFSNGLDVKHVTHMLRFAHEAFVGTTRLVTIMSPSYSFNGKKESVAFRRWLGRRQQAGDDVRIEQLPEGTFAEMGTNVCSHLIALDVTQEDRMELDGYLRELK